ncbi:37S ribosomal protein MRP4, mitochondrial [Pseudocercospora fuligena]|uniref:37S ribosomal protein MRP4, mitochondrial n=1 Tax=Pseudocercospora fuligena TaxID=685502 RepID=A0A8H6RQG9_9PEZI|nr:37S ribosomal protein MRP4, mitochondrial [Pseudocercospora fuligena]
MIIRSLRPRHGRIALPRQLPARRYQSSLEHSSQETQAPAGVPVFSAPSSQQDASVQAIVREVPLNDPNHPVAQDYAFYKHQKRVTQNVGSAIAPHYRPHELLTNPPRPSDITLELLIASQAHIGHSTSLWNPANARYIFGVRGDHDPIHIISPDVTAAHLRRACKVVSGVAERGGLILFVGTREGQARAVVKAAELSKGCHLFTKWIPGTITNGQQILGRCEKKVVDEKDQDVAGFEDQLGAKAAIKPDLVVCLNPLENYILLHECGLNNIPTIGIIDTDANPTWVTYPIPANDDSLRAVQVIAGVLGRAGQAGQEARLSRAARDGFVVYPAIHGLTAPGGRDSDDRRTTREPRRRAIRQPSATAEEVSTASRAAAVSPAGEEAVFPEDYDGVDVKQSEKDQALLSEAEKMMAATHEDFPSAARDGVEGAAAVPSAEEMSDMDAAEDDGMVEQVDPSLTDENFANTEASTNDEDLAQFGIHSASTIDQVDDVQKELQEQPEGESTFEQVADVEQELGEKAPEPEVTGNPDIKDADKESQKEVDGQKKI